MTEEENIKESFTKLMEVYLLRCAEVSFLKTKVPEGVTFEKLEERDPIAYMNAILEGTKMVMGDLAAKFDIGNLGQPGEGQAPKSET